MLMVNFKELSWQYWFATACLLTAGLAGVNWAFQLAIAVTVIQLFHFVLREHSLVAFPVQVRFWYLMLLIASFPGPMQVVYWIPAVGTWAQLVFGYCAMARLVSMFPWNRKEPFSLKLMQKTFISRPVRGNVLQGQPPLR